MLKFGTQEEDTDSPETFPLCDSVLERQLV